MLRPADDAESALSVGVSDLSSSGVPHCDSGFRLLLLSVGRSNKIIKQSLMTLKDFEMPVQPVQRTGYAASIGGRF